MGGYFPPGSFPNSGGDSKGREKEEERLRREEEEQEIENRRASLLEQDKALAAQEEIVQENWEIVRNQRMNVSQAAFDLEQGIIRRVDLETGKEDSHPRIRRRASYAMGSWKSRNKRRRNSGNRKKTRRRPKSR